MGETGKINLFSYRFTLHASRKKFPPYASRFTPYEGISLLTGYMKTIDVNHYA